MRKYIIMVLLLGLYGCSSGLSDSKALKIAEGTENFATTECTLLRVNQVMAATPESTYIVDGVQVTQRDETAEQMHHFSPRRFISLNLKDVEGNVINLLGNKYMMALQHRFSGACAGCVYCYDAFAKKGLMTVSYADGDPDVYGFRRSDVKLTDEGEKYIIEWEDPEAGMRLECGALNANTGDAVTVKLMQRVYTGAKKVWENGDCAEFYLQYYYDMTPYGEALFGPTRKEPSYQTKATYKKDAEGRWSLVKLEDLSGYADDVREF